MLSPMLVQYLIGLCCLRRNPDAVDVIVGDLVLDVAAEKHRDVDVTVTLREGDGTVRAFKACEVKHEKAPLDVTTVEQLCIKFQDMPEVTHRAIVSSSHFTDGAIKKALAHDVQLLILKPWTRPLAEQFSEFSNVGCPQEFLRGKTTNLLFWMDWQLFAIVPDGPPSFNVESTSPCFGGDGRIHEKFANYAEFTNALVRRSVDVLWQLEPAQTIARTFPSEPAPDNGEIEVTPAWPHSHTLDVEQDRVFLRFATRLALIRSVTISGRLQWHRRHQPLAFHVLEDASTHQAFAGIAVAEWGTPDGRMSGFIFGPDSRVINIHPVIKLQEKHKNAIRKLKLSLSIAPPGSES